MLSHSEPPNKRRRPSRLRLRQTSREVQTNTHPREFHATKAAMGKTRANRTRRQSRRRRRSSFRSQEATKSCARPPCLDGRSSTLDQTLTIQQHHSRRLTCFESAHTQTHGLRHRCQINDEFDELEVAVEFEAPARRCVCAVQSRESAAAKYESAVLPA